MGFIGVEKVKNSNNQFIPDVSSIPQMPEPNTVVVSSVPASNVSNVSNVNNSTVYSNANNNMQAAISNGVNYVDTRNIDMNSQVVQNQEQVTQMVSATPEEVLDENVEVLDPLNNGTNPVPVNPVSNEPSLEVDQFDRYLISPGDCIKLVFTLLVKPGDALKDCSKKCKKLKNGIFLFIAFLLLSLILSLIGGVISAVFVKSFNTLTESFSTTITFSNITTHNYIDGLFNTLFLIDLPVLIFALIYYASSFISSKGLTLGSYIGLSVLSLLPFSIGFSILYPIGYVISDYVAIIFVVISLLYSLILFIVGINECIDFNNSNQKIIYNGINLALVFTILFLIALLVYFDGVLPVSIL